MYIHPLHNYAVVAYDPQPDRHDTGEVRASSRRASCSAGESVWVVGLGADSQMHARSTEIASIEPLELPLSRTMRFRDSNLEIAQLVNPPAEFDGVLADKSGNVLGTWSSFAYENGRELAQDNRGVPIDLVADMLDRVRTERPLHSLEAELGVLPLAERARARPVGGLGADASRSTRPTRRAGADASCAWSAARRPPSCCSRATCCSPSTARW